MENAQPPLLTHQASPDSPKPAAPRRRNTVTFKLLFIAGLVLLLQLPLTLINELRQERSNNRAAANERIAERRAAPTSDQFTAASSGSAATTVNLPDGVAYNPATAASEGYRMVGRALKYSVLILTLTFTAFFLFETLAGLRLHAVHYGLVGAALCLFYLALLALGEVMEPGAAYIAAAVASSLLIVLYSASVLHSYARAGVIATLLTAEHSVLYVTLRMEDYALLAGTGSLFVALAALMYFTRNVDWFAQETGREAARA